MKSKSEIRERQDSIINARDEDYENHVLQAKDELLGFLLGDMDSPAGEVTEPPTTDEELDKLIEAIKAEYKDLPEYSAFGDSNWKVRDAEIEMCEWAKGA